MAKNGGKSSGGSFLEKLLSLFGGGDPEADKKRLLRNIAKNLSHSKFKFYKPNGDQVLPLFGKFIWELYRSIGPCQMLFQNQENPNYFKHIVINYSLSEEQKALEESLQEDSIKNEASKMKFPELKQKVKEELDTFIGGFTDEKVIKTDSMYTVLMAFRSFCTFDFFFMLKKFDSSLREGDFNSTPRFESIDASYLIDDIKDFASIIESMPFDSDWNSMLAMFKEVRGTEPIKANQWAKTVQRLENLRRSRVLDMMIQLITKDPTYQTNGETRSEQIVDPFIDKIRNEATNTVARIESEQKNSKVDGILMQIFNTTNITVLKNYTEGGGSPFAKKDLGDFEHARALNYLKAFLVEYVKRDVREYADLVLIRGQWATTPLSQQMSDAYNVILQVSDAITNFDDKMAVDGEVGIKLKTHLPSTERSKEAANIIRTLIGDANDEAKGYIVTCTKNIIIFARNVKALIDDYPKKNPEMIINWKELDRFAEHPINELAVEVYKKMYLISTLMQNLLTGGQ